VRPFRRSREQRWAGGIVALVLLGVGFVPLFGGPGYEQALASGLVVPSAAALATAFDLDDRDAPSPFACVLRGLSSGLFLAAIAFATALVHALRVGLCDLLGGALDFALTAGFGALLGGAWGAVVAEATRRRRMRAFTVVLAALSLPLLGIVTSLLRFYTSPMVFAFDPFFGYFSGTLYDTVIDAGTALVTYRVGSLATILALVLAASVLVRDARGRIRFARVRDQAGGVARLLLGAACAAVSLGITACGAELGHWETSATIAEHLRGQRSGARCDVVYPDSVLSDDAALLVKDCDEELVAVERELGARGPDRVRAFFFRDAAEKKRLMGAGDTYIAKPWRKEVYLQIGAYPHPVLGHELAHVVAGNFGRGPFRIAGKLGGLWPNPGLIEGTAVAASPDDDELTDAQWAHAMLDLGALPPMSSVFSFDFLGAPAAKSYTIAGAFVRWIKDRFGSETVRAWYGGGSLEELTHETWTALDRAFRESAAATPLSSEASSYARAKFEHPAIFGRRCPHVVDGLRQRADACREAHETDRAIELYDDVLLRDPHDWAARYGRAVIQLRFADGEAGRRELRAMAEGADEPRTWRDRTLDALADADLLDGRAAEAADAYQKLAVRSVDEDFGRTEEVKALAAVDAAGRNAVTALLLGAPGRASDMVLAASRLTAWEDRTGSSLAAYLLGKNLEQRGWRIDADGHLDRVLGAADYPTMRVGREVIRDRAIDACAEGDAVAVERMRGRILSSEGPYATSVGRKEYVLRMLARCTTNPAAP
jgi:tetratricopeptide (TPR) repeat protein